MVIPQLPCSAADGLPPTAIAEAPHTTDKTSTWLLPQVRLNCVAPIGVCILARDNCQWIWSWFSVLFGKSFSVSISGIMNDETLKIERASALISA
jgi:hypothetical protein